MRKSPLAVALAASLLAAAPAFADDAPATGWPRTFEDSGETYTVYQPQLESWDQIHLAARAAVSVAPDDKLEEARYGVVWFTATTSVDKEERLVTLSAPEVPRASFPTAPDKEAAWLAVLKRHFETGAVKTVHLDRLESAFALVRAERAALSAAPLRNDPPKIFFSTRPSLLVLIDGDPVTKHVSYGEHVNRVINTRALIVQDDRNGRFYLAVGTNWLGADGLDGPWTFTKDIPEGSFALRNSLAGSGSIDLYDENNEINTLVANGEAPLVFTSTTPAELLETYGEPDLVSVAGTRLLYAKNSASDLFVDTATNRRYVLISGRWFAADSLDGPWSYVAGTDLPGDFRRIPPDDPAGEVLAAVPGTPQAQEALIENEVPQTATVKRAEATCEVTFDGEPELQPIEGTEIRYVSNCSTPVVYCDNVYYACRTGVWFRCGHLRGERWVCCDSVPAAIYTIPPSCPLHYVTYVRVYRATPELVVCGYTPGYFGTCATREGVVVWGTGYHHRAWVRDTWIGRPATYGFGVSVHSCATGFGVGIGTNTRVYARPWWGPLSHPHEAHDIRRDERHVDIHINNANIYSHWKTAVVERREDVVRREAFERREAAERHEDVERRERLERERIERERRAPAPVRANNVYSTPEGKVYRRSDEGHWEARENGAWKRAEPSVEAQREHERLEREHQARTRGDERVQRVERAPARPVAPAPRPVEHHEAPRPVEHHEAPRPAPQHYTPAPRPVPQPGLRGGSTHHTAPPPPPSHDNRHH